MHLPKGAHSRQTLHSYTYPNTTELSVFLNSNHDNPFVRFIVDTNHAHSHFLNIILKNCEVRVCLQSEQPKRNGHVFESAHAAQVLNVGAHEERTITTHLSEAMFKA